jgi:hypothetical protein
VAAVEPPHAAVWNCRCHRFIDSSGTPIHRRLQLDRTEHWYMV